MIECDFAANLASVKIKCLQSVNNLQPKIDQLEDATEQRQQ
jgi:hypothetical protein